MKLIALYKTFSGEDFVIASIESIYKHCDKIVFVHSNYSWMGEKGNTVAPVVENWCKLHDVEHKIINLYTNINDQEKQYDFGVDYIKKHITSASNDFIMLIDTDEVWDDVQLVKALKLIDSNSNYTAFSIMLHTYIKSIFYRITPPEWCRPTAFVRSSVPKLVGIRGNNTSPKLLLEDVYMHHFTYVRLKEKDVIDKIKRTTFTEKEVIFDLDWWIREKWNKLPYAKDFHTVKSATTSWHEIRVISLNELPETMIKNGFHKGFI